MPQRRTQWVAASLHGLRAVASWKMLIEELLHIAVCQIPRRKPTPPSPACEMGHAAQVNAHSSVGVALLDEAAPIRWNERGKVTVAQPCGWHVVYRSKSVHKIS
jgi:hypothetical protein